MHFPVKRVRLFNFLLLKSSFSYFNYIGYLNFPETFGLLILKAASNATLLIFPAAILLFAVSISRNFVKRDAYLEDIIKNSSKKYDAADRLTFLKKYGNTGNLLRIELKLIWRNKRSKMYLV